MIGLAASYMSTVGGDVVINEMVWSCTSKDPAVVGHKDDGAMTVCKLHQPYFDCIDPTSVCTHNTQTQARPTCL